MNRLDDKVALITGGARGQGAAEAALFLQAGAKVIITDILDDAGQATADKLGPDCTFIHHDVSSEEDWSQVADQVMSEQGKIDVLVNNAGVFRLGDLEHTSRKKWDQIVAVNQTGTYLGMRSVLPAMKASKKGSIINISSVAGLESAAIAHAYSATKWAIRGMTKSAAVELAPFGIRVNSVHPGLIETDMWTEFGSDLQNYMLTKVPMGRVAQAEEVAKLVLFLASDDSGYCSGHEFVADGAMAS